MPTVAPDGTIARHSEMGHEQTCGTGFQPVELQAEHLRLKQQNGIQLSLPARYSIHRAG